MDSIIKVMNRRDTIHTNTEGRGAWTQYAEIRINGVSTRQNTTIKDSNNKKMERGNGPNQKTSDTNRLLKKGFADKITGVLRKRYKGSKRSQTEKVRPERKPGDPGMLLGGGRAQTTPGKPGGRIVCF